MLPADPLTKRMLKKELEEGKKDFLHSSAYAKAQNEGVGVASTESFAERQKIDRERTKVENYDKSDMMVERTAKMDTLREKQNFEAIVSRVTGGEGGVSGFVDFGIEGVAKSSGGAGTAERSGREQANLYKEAKERAEQAARFAPKSQKLGTGTGPEGAKTDSEKKGYGRTGSEELKKGYGRITPEDRRGYGRISAEERQGYGRTGVEQRGNFGRVGSEQLRSNGQLGSRPRPANPPAQRRPGIHL